MFQENVPRHRLSRLISSRVSLAPGMEIGYVIRDARKCEVDQRSASKFDAEYYHRGLEKAWEEAAFVFTSQKPYSASPYFGVI